MATTMIRVTKREKSHLPYVMNFESVWGNLAFFTEISNFTFPFFFSLDFLSSSGELLSLPPLTLLGVLDVPLPLHSLWS
jgi:hypothetical protein